MKILVFVFSISVVNCLLQITFAQNSNYDVEPIKPGPLGAEVCMDELGCFKMTKDYFHAEWRPINFLPEDRKIIDTRFYLYTKRNPMEYVLLKHNDVDSLEQVDSSISTIFLVHGFLSDTNLYTKWMLNMKEQLLLSREYNVIIVDWSGGNQFPYTRATANTRVVGAEIALLVKSLMKNRSLDPMKVHIAGHSLGAHIAGYAGERIKTLGRITGLDPAAPYFQHMPPSIRLDPTDADFVDVIHTDSIATIFMAWGMRDPCGHIDFYPNDGHKQPGCQKEVVQSIFLEGLVDATRRFFTCNHQRSTDYFIYSVNYKRALPVGFQCSSYRDFALGLCSDCNNHRCSVMGIEADQFRPYKNDSNSVKMYLATGDVAPYWQFTYKLKIKLPALNNVAQQNHQGSMNIIIKGKQSNYNATIGPFEIVHGFTYTYLVRETKPLGKIEGITFTWTSHSYNTFFRDSTIYLESVAVLPMNIADMKQQTQQTKTFCTERTKAVDSNIPINLMSC